MRRLLPAFFAVTALVAQTGPTQQNWPPSEVIGMRSVTARSPNRSNKKKLTPGWVFQTGVSDGGIASDADRDGWRDVSSE